MSTQNSTWANVERYNNQIPEHIAALSRHCIQAGSDAYEDDVANGRNLLPYPSPYMDKRSVPEDDARLNAGKAYAGKLLASEPAKFGYDFPLKPVAHWFLIGYDEAREKATHPPTSTIPSNSSL